MLLQQCLPFTVLKPEDTEERIQGIEELQQCLPFTVLKPYHRIMLVSFD